MLKEKLHLEKTITLNGNCVFGKMSHSRGSPQFHPGLRIEVWDTHFPQNDYNITRAQYQAGRISANARI